MANIYDKILIFSSSGSYEKLKLVCKVFDFVAAERIESDFEFFKQTLNENNHYLHNIPNSP